MIINRSKNGVKNIQAAAYNGVRTVIEDTPAFLIELFSFLHGIKKTLRDRQAENHLNLIKSKALSSKKCGQFVTYAYIMS